MTKPNYEKYNKTKQKRQKNFIQLYSYNKILLLLFDVFTIFDY